MTDLLRLGLTNALATAALAVLVGALTFPLRRRRPALVHALWLLVLVKLITPPVWTVPVRWPVPPGSAPRDGDVVDVGVIEPYVLVDEGPVGAVVGAPVQTEPVNWLRRAVVTCGVAWAAGSVACLGLIVFRLLQFRCLLRHSTPASPDVVRRVRRLAARLDLAQPPTAYFVPGAVCPMLYAAGGRPRLLLPRGLWERLGDDQRDTLVAHELAHLRRRDHWVRLVEVAATVLYWWNPVLWWARRELREAEEQCCDAWVLWSMPAAVRHYMSAILEAVEFVSEPTSDGGRRPLPTVPALASGMGEFRRLERRLWMIRRNESPRGLGRPGLLAVVLAAAAALPLAPAMAEPDAPGADVEPREVIVRPLAPEAADAPPADPAAPVAVGADVVVESDVAVESDVSIESGVSFAPGEKTITIGADRVVIGKSHDEVTERVFDPRTGNTIEVRGKTVRIVNGTDLEQARAEVERARANLAAATARLEKLEAMARDGKVKPGKSAKATYVKMKVAPGRKDDLAGMRTDGPMNYRDVKEKGSADEADRMRQLERKLEQIDAMLKEIRVQEAGRQGDRRDGKDTGADAPSDPAPRKF